MNLGEDFIPTDIDPNKLNLASKWILAKLNKVIENVDYNMEKYEFGEAARTLYSFVWDDFASWYVEISKVDLASSDEQNIQMTKNVLLHTLLAIIKMLHPFVPFITEEIYQALPHNEESITISSWPKVDERFNNDDAIESIDDMIEIITAIRNERNKAGKGLSKPIDISIYSDKEYVVKMIESTKEYLEKFTNPRNLQFLTNDIDPKDYVTLVLPMAKVYVPTADLVDKEEVIKKLNQEKARLEGELMRSKNMLSNEKFLSKAPKDKIDAEKAKQAEYQKQYDEILKTLKEYND